MRPLEIAILLLLIVSVPAISADPLTVLSQAHHKSEEYLGAAESILSDSGKPTDEAVAAMASRVTALFESRTPRIGNVPDLTVACRIALRLYRAAPERTLPLLQKHTARCVAAAAISGTVGDRFLTYAAEFCELRHQAGDAAAIDDYVAFLPSADPDSFTQLPKLLHFLLANPDEPKLSALAESLFNGTGEWNPIFGINDRYYSGYTARDIYAEPLLWKHPAFRTQLRRLLADTGAAGKITIIDSESIAIAIRKGWVDSMTETGWRGKLPERGTELGLRVCDLHGIYAARQPGAPAFEPFWSEAEKNAALAKLIAHYR